MYKDARMMSDAKKIGQSDLAENTQFKQMKAPFETKPQWESSIHLTHFKR